MDRPNTYPNRTFCDVCHDMRKCYKTLNFTMLAGLIEECQVFGNRMESALENQKDYMDIDRILHEIKAEYKPLRKQYDELQKEKKQLQEDIEELKELRGKI
jgi:peptidoglycan hydrolase CwlO-like protein